MAGEITLHVTDASRGAPAVGMQVEIFALVPERRRMLSGFLDGNGVLGTAATDFPRGLYEVVLHVGTFCASEGLGRSEPPFLDEVPVRFAVSQPNERYQLSIYITPWSYSVFRAS